MSENENGVKRLSANVPEDLYKEFAKRCIEKGVKKQDYLTEILRKEFARTEEKK